VKAAPNDSAHMACGIHCICRCRFKPHVRQTDRQTDRQTPRTSVRIVGISYIRCSLKTRHDLDKWKNLIVVATEELRQDVAACVEGL